MYAVDKWLIKCISNQKKKKKERGGETCSLICQKSCCTNFGIQFLPSDCVLFIDFLLDDQNVI